MMEENLEAIEVHLAVLCDHVNFWAPISLFMNLEGFFTILKKGVWGKESTFICLNSLEEMVLNL